MGKSKRRHLPHANRVHRGTNVPTERQKEEHEGKEINQAARIILHEESKDILSYFMQSAMANASVSKPTDWPFAAVVPEELIYMKTG